MKITKTEISYYKWQLPKPVWNGVRTWSHLELGVLKVHTDQGLTGIGVSNPKPGEREMLADFSQQIIGMDPFMTEKIWPHLWHPKWTGRRGVGVRALSTVDLALWDIKAKAANLPLYVLLGGARERIPVYMTGGLYSENKGLDGLAAEMADYVSRGARAVKMKVGALSIREDAMRVKAVRDAVGPDVKVMVDANFAYRFYEAIRFARAIVDYDVFWFEEPVHPDDYDGLRKLGQAVPITIATGENEYTLFGFRDIIATKAVGILNPDVRYMGGVTEFMKVAALAQAEGMDICPHGDQQAHLHVMAAIPNGLMIEYFPREFDPMWGMVYTNTAEFNEDGTVTVPQTPGNGLVLNEKELKRHLVS